MSKNKGGKFKIKPKTTDSLNKMVYKKTKNKKRNCLAAGKETEEKQTGKENIERLKQINGSRSERNRELVSS